MQEEKIPVELEDVAYAGLMKTRFDRINETQRKEGGVKIRYEIDGDQRLGRIELHFPAEKYNIQPDTFNRVDRFIRRSTKRVVFATSDATAFELGVMSFYVASRSHEYNPSKIIGAFTFVIEKFFPEIDKQATE